MPPSYQPPPIAGDAEAGFHGQVNALLPRPGNNTQAQPLAIALLATLLLAACTGGTNKSTPIGNAGAPPTILAARWRSDDGHQFAEIALRSEQNLGSTRLPDRIGKELHVRLHPDANQVVFARERNRDAPGSRELFLGTIDNSRAEQRLTQNDVRDDEPCWSPDGSEILYTSEVAGNARLWLLAPATGLRRLFLEPPAGHSDGEADWSRSTDRVVFSRRDGNGRHRLWLANGDGSGAQPLTDGGLGTTAGSGDRQPAFAADGQRVAFVRQLHSGQSQLCLCDLATSTVAVRLQPAGELSLPRFAPDGDRLFCGIAEPTPGRDGMRLAWLPTLLGDPVLLWPDRRWNLAGLDLLPTLLPPPAAAAPQTLDIRRANVEIAAGSIVFGTRQQLHRLDGEELIVRTARTDDGREVAGIACRFDLPVLRAEDVLELELQAVARLSSVAGNPALRMSIYNPVDRRFDTAVELQPGDTGTRSLRCRLGSLRHLTRQRQLRLTVIGDFPPGASAELRIDLVEVVMTPRSAPL